jgi:hypothetical protein
MIDWTPDWREQYGDREALAEEFHREVALGHVLQHSRDDAPPPERLAVPAGGVLPARAPDDVGGGFLGEGLHRRLAEVVGVGREVGALVGEHPAGVHLPLAIWTVGLCGVVHACVVVAAGSYSLAG